MGQAEKTAEKWRKHRASTDYCAGEPWVFPGGRHRGRRLSELSDAEVAESWDWYQEHVPDGVVFTRITDEMRHRELPMPVRMRVVQPRSPQPSVAQQAAYVSHEPGARYCYACGRDLRSRDRDKLLACCGWLVLQTGWIGVSEDTISRYQGEGSVRWQT